MKKKLLAVLLVLGMLAQLLPWWPATNEVNAAADLTDIYLPGGGKVVNREDMTYLQYGFQKVECNSFRLFTAGTPGMQWSSDDGDAPNANGVYHVDGHFYGRITVSQNPVLKRLAEGGQAYFMVRAGKLNSTGDHGAYIWAYTQKFSWWNAGGDNRPGYGTTSSYWNAGSGTEDPDYNNAYSSWMKLDINDTLVIETETHGAGTQVEDIELYFADITPPTYNGNTFTTDGTVRYNTALNKNELFLKEGNNVNLALNFSEPVFPTSAVSASEMVDGKFKFMRTELFDNPGGDGFNPSKYYLDSAEADYNSFSAGSININDNSKSTFNVKYAPSRNDSTGNMPLDPLKLTAASADNPTLLQRINESGFVDGAGNPLADISSIGVVPFGNNDNPNGTYRTIIDARPPKYSPVKNGVQPDILTGLVLNKGDTIDFTVNLNEKVINAINPATGTRLAFNNGMLADYLSGSNTETWKFSATVPDGTAAETSGLETAALEHVSKIGDGNVIWDYAQNYLTEAVKSISWADISIDNTPPNINYIFRNENDTVVEDGKFVKSGNITIKAEDPLLNGAAGKGIYRPGSTSEGNGLVYYMWSKSAADPFMDKNDNFAAVKRYSLTAKQPSEDLYTSGYTDIQFSVANNGSAIPLPAEASGKSENWYLHTWTADMTWDSARQLMQYEKGSVLRAAYLAGHPDATPAEIETNFRKFILPYMSQYEDLAQWPLEDYKKDDSNWVYKCATLKLDNDKPSISTGNVIDNMTDNVKITISASDPTSSIKDGKVKYQFVKKGEELDDSEWIETSLNAQGKSEIYTLGNPVIINGGKYEIYAKAEDEAGNTEVSQPVEIDVLVINTVFESYGNGYAINNGPDFTICGVPIETLEYQFAYSSEQPTTSWAAISVRIPAELKGETGYKYDIPADKSKNGTVYLHIKVKQQDLEHYYYYFKEYKFDQLPPVVTFGSQGYLYPLPEQQTNIAVEDSLVDFSGVADENIQYQWVKVIEGEDEIAPEKDSESWKQVPSDRAPKLVAQNKAEDGNYRLYVYAKDSLGNGKIYKITGLFSVYYLSHEPPIGSAGLIYTAGNVTDGYTAILKLEVDVPSQVGYFYSVSSNGGENWSTWRPYTNYVGVPVDTDDATELAKTIKVKFRGYFLDNVSEIYSPEINIQDAPAYALASLDKIEPVRGGEKVLEGGTNTGVEIDFSQTDDKTITPTLANPEVPEILEANKKFLVYQNGCYSFNVVDGDKTALIYMVVSNFDNTPPVASIKYTVIKKTSGSVTASLKSSEPIRVINNSSNIKTFDENGEFTFEFEDAVGLTGSAIALVNNIDKTPPEAEVVLHYNNPDMKALINYQGQTVVVNSSGYGYDSAGEYKQFEAPTTENVIASNLIMAEVRPKDGAESDFKVIRNNTGSSNSTITIQSNEAARFTLMDAAGNIATVTSSAITTVCNTSPEVTNVILQRIDDNGNILDSSKIVMINGKEYSKGRVKVSFETVPSEIAQNIITIGSRPVDEFSKSYSQNGKERLILIDRLGNRNSQLITIEGLDNTPPEITLNMRATTILQNKSEFDFKTDLGGYEVSDNISTKQDIKVEVVEEVLENGSYVEKSFNISKPGMHKVKYIVTDQVGNKSTATQLVYVTSSDGMYIMANGVPLSPDETDTAILNTATVSFSVNNYNSMKVGNAEEKMKNEEGTYDIYYYPGLYREGQMKYIATKLTYTQLLKGDFTVVLPKAGWYTIIVRNQERESVYATMLVSKVK